VEEDEQTFGYHGKLCVCKKDKGFRNPLDAYQMAYPIFGTPFDMHDYENVDASSADI